MDSLQGHLLVASPYLPDPNFLRSVVLMIDHQDEGALGLILNRRSTTRLADIWQSVCETPCLSEDFLCCGGPVEGPLMTLHASDELGGHEIVPGVWFSSDRDILVQLVSQASSPYHVFNGYAGWGAGQLEAELKIGGWLTTPAKHDHIFGQDEEGLWQRVVNSIGAEITQRGFKPHQVPFDPNNN